MRSYRPCGIDNRLWEANFRFARQPPTIVTCAEPHFYDLPLIRPSGFVNSAAFLESNRREHAFLTNTVSNTQIGRFVG